MTMQEPFKPYPRDLLPRGFRYPQRYLNFAETGEYPAIYPWWFIDAESEVGRLAYEVGRLENAMLVPFAKIDDSAGDIACFDGNDSTGNPRIIMLITDGSGRAYSFNDFDDWLSAATRDATSRGASIEV